MILMQSSQLTELNHRASIFVYIRVCALITEHVQKEQMNSESQDTEALTSPPAGLDIDLEKESVVFSSC